MIPFLAGLGVGVVLCALGVVCLAWFAGQRPPDPLEWDVEPAEAAHGHYVSSRGADGVVAGTEWCAGPPGWVRR